MTRLLVSVRSAAEAGIALAGGADVIDIKEPSRGPLGAADPQSWSEVLHAVGGRAMVSAALGELQDAGVTKLAASASGLRFAKIGLAGCHTHSGWLSRWQRVIGQLPPAVLPVPVAYADWPGAAAPSPSVALT